ncbi:hypothetical protein [Pseudoalteromonas sp.]
MAKVTSYQPNPSRPLAITTYFSFSTAHLLEHSTDHRPTGTK